MGRKPALITTRLSHRHQLRWEWLRKRARVAEFAVEPGVVVVGLQDDRHRFGMDWRDDRVRLARQERERRLGFGWTPHARKREDRQ